MLDELMSNLSKTAILGTAVLGGVAMYDEMTPPAATYFQHVQVAPQNIQSPSENNAESFVYSKVESDLPTTKANSIIVDLQGTGPPEQDNYPRSPAEVNQRTNLQLNLNSQNNFGLVNRSNN